MEHTATLRTGTASPARAVVLKALLICGAISSVLYVASDILASMSYPGYVYADQMFSELLALGSPVRQYMIPAMNVYNLLVIAFGVGVWLVAGSQRSLRVTGALVTIYGVLSAVGPYVPMHVRGTGTSLTDLLHVVCTVGLLLSMMGFVGVGALTNGKGFRNYSIATLLAIVVGGVIAGTQGVRMSAGLTTPGFGLVERVNIYAMMLWVAVFAVTLLRGNRPVLSAEGR